MALQKYSFKVLELANLVRLDTFLFEELSKVCRFPVSKGQVRKLILAGAVYLNRKRVRIASKELRPGAQIDILLRTEEFRAESQQNLNRSRQSEWVVQKDDILYEDDWIVVLNKPAGVPTQPTIDQARGNLFDAIKRYYQAIKPVQYLGLHHRLDRDTSGIVLLSKSKEVNKGIADLFLNHQIQKTYLAVCEIQGIKPVPQSPWQVKNHLGVIKRIGKKQKFGAVTSGGDLAITDFEWTEKNEIKKLIWIKAKPQTGRTHQIRVHLSELGLPILGDTFYGGAALLDGQAVRVQLHAMELEFKHPKTGLECKVVARLPKDFLASP